MVETSRRSARPRVANRKYANSDWDKSTLKLLRESSESSGSTASNSEIEQLAGPDPEFDLETEKVEKELSDHSLHNDSDAASSQIPTPDDSGGDGKLKTVRKPPIKVSTPLALAAANEGTSGTHIRGLNTDFKEARQKVRYQNNFGPELDDLEPILCARDQWMRGRDITFPSRRSLDAALEAGRKQQAAKLSTGSMEDAMMTNPVGSYNQQKLRDIFQEQERGRFLTPTQKHSVVLGAWKKQRSYELETYSPFRMGKAWIKDKRKKSSATTIAPTAAHHSDHLDQTSLPADGDLSTEKTAAHEAWLLNVGSKVMCLSWAPSEGGVQYLAIACRSTDKQCNTTSDAKLQTAPAFTPSQAYPSNIQIWTVYALDTDGTATRRLDTTGAPELTQLICMEYGNIRELHWQPRSAGNAGDAERATEPQIGTLAVVSSDGCVRLIEVPKQRDPGNVFSLVEKPAFTARPRQDVVYTSCTFCSPTDLAVGASDGSAVIYDLSDDSERDTPQPYLTVQLHSTYIMSICSAYPDDISYLIASSSANGDFMLTDLRSPEQDKIRVHRARLPVKALHYSPQTRSFITTTDSVGMSEAKSTTLTSIVCHNIRHFYHTTTLGRLPEGSGSATTVAGSPHHPCLLVGNAAGTVYATNLVRKMILAGRPTSSSYNLSYLQKLCEYDWHPLEKKVEAPVDLFHGQDARPGVSRFHEGFRPEKVDLIAGGPARRRGEQHGETAMLIFEEEQAVTAMAWNPSARCSSWAAVGWGSGIVRIQDLANDVT